MCSIDWAAVGAMLGGLSTLALAIIAFITRETWQKQIIYQRRREISEDLILYGHEVLSLIERMYYPYPRNGEIQRMSRRHGENDQDFELRRNYGWREQALEEASGSVEKLRVASMLAAVNLERSVQEKADRLLGAVESIVAGSRGMIEFQRNNAANPIAAGTARESPVRQERSQQYTELENQTWLEDRRLAAWKADYAALREECEKSLKTL